jgi:factor associated with neutral sphingomyelinase activation
MLLIFDNKEERTRASRILSKHSSKPVPDPVVAAAAAQASWLAGTTTNFSYILELNMLAGRSFNDLTQYPVFPWVISQYSEPTLDLLNKRTFRNLSSPIGALNQERLAMFQDRLHQIPAGEPRFLYGTHYSSPGYVIYFLVREVPDLMLKLQSGKFDAPDRLFQSISRTWNGVLTSAGDVKELTPEFYYDENLSTGQGGGSFLMNRMGLKLGSRQDGQKVDNVILPPWASSSRAYIQSNRQALECPYVSSQLHSWIDLIFGAKQRGAAAEAAHNLFHPLTYSNEIGIKTVSGIHDRRAVEIQIGEFGQANPLVPVIFFQLQRA